METKKQIRREMLQKRDALTAEERGVMSQSVFSQLSKLPEFIKAEQILLFAGYGSEPDTLPWIAECVAMGKNVLCPVVTGEEMQFYEISALQQLKAGYKGIPEPEPDESTCYRKRECDLMVLPGTAFDVSGNRIGYGKGFYDRYLAAGFSGETVAVAFSFQVLEEKRIPAEETDRKVNCIVTEKEVIRI